MSMKFVTGVAAAAAVSLAASSIAYGQDAANKGAVSENAAVCPADNGGLILPRGFCATVFADVEGAPRHIAVASDGTVYVNAAVRQGKAGEGPVVALKDSNGDGRADIAVPPAVVIDVGKISGSGWAVVEANPVFGSGIYKCDPIKVLPVLARSLVPVQKISQSDRQWVIQRNYDNSV